MSKAIVCDICGRLRPPSEVLDWYEVRQDGQTRDYCCRQHLILAEALAERGALGTCYTVPAGTPGVVRVVLDWPAPDSYRIEQRIGPASGAPSPIERSA